MIRATQVKPHHRWTEAPADTVVLDFDDRHRRRMAMIGTRVLPFSRVRIARAASSPSMPGICTSIKIAS